MIDWMNRSSPLRYFRLSLLRRVLISYWNRRRDVLCTYWERRKYVTFFLRLTARSRRRRKKSIDFMRIHGSQVRKQQLTLLRFQRQQQYESEREKIRSSRLALILLIAAKPNLFFKRSARGEKVRTRIICLFPLSLSSLISNTNNNWSLRAGLGITRLVC